MRWVDAHHVWRIYVQLTLYIKTTHSLLVKKYFLGKNKISASLSLNTYSGAELTMGTFHDTSNSVCRKWKHMLDHPGWVQTLPKTKKNEKNRQFWHGRSYRNYTQKQLGIENAHFITFLLFLADSVPSLGGQICVSTFYYESHRYC